MTDSTIAPLVLDGWYVLHQFFDLEPEAPSGEDASERAKALQELFEGWEDLGEGGWSGLYRVVGGGADLMAIHFRPSLDALADAERTLRRHPAARELHAGADYVSVVELGLYAVTAALLEKAEMEGVQVGSDEWTRSVEQALAAEASKPYTQRRLRPRQPLEMPYVCFYPMDKRRRADANWYTLPLAERADLMTAHGRTGRRYAGRVLQVISGSVGFDNWEWAVTLFSGDPLHFKSLITDMRYDEATSRYADFGSFWVGIRVPAAEIADALGPLPG